MPLLEAEHIVKTFPGDPPVEVLRGVSLELNKGEVVSIVGASGAGKSTLLHILGTLDTPSSGHVIINGEEPFKMKEKKLAAFRNNTIGFVFQFHQLLPEFTAVENIIIPALIGKRKESEATQKAMDLLDMLGLAERALHKPSELSGGEQQRVAVARALINNPEIIFADEPSGNLDTHNAKELHELFFELKKQLNKTFVIVTHNLQLSEMADRKLVMKDGLLQS
jgi:lipoprotein-releasing system ATP-binding protein